MEEDKHSPSQRIIRLAQLQELLFGENLSRREILSWQTENKDLYQLKVQVIRNHSFELVENVLAPFLEYSGYSAKFNYAGYDDSMSIEDINLDCDLYLVWFDFKGLSSKEQRSHFEGQLRKLRDLTNSPIILGGIDSVQNFEFSGIKVFCFDEIRQELNEDFLDEERKLITGTRLSMKSTTRIAQRLGLIEIPYVLPKFTKGIICDLDNTLYDGVLGEDGPDGIDLTKEHADLQKRLKELSEKGTLLSIVSKNNLEDVLEMFRSRSDFPLQEKDFFQIHAGWGNKSESIKTVLSSSNTHAGANIFVDDNIAEHIQVAAEIPELLHVFANSSGSRTRHVLELFPGLNKKGVNSLEDRVRAKDLISNNERKKYLATGNLDDSFRELETELVFFVNPADKVARLHELSSKTNQFVFSFTRFPEHVIVERIENPEKAVIAISLRDKISDSGVIAALFFSKSQNEILLEETVISCRALGRKLEPMIVLYSCKLVLEMWGITEITTSFVKGPRNDPALMFFEEYLRGKSSTALMSTPLPSTIKVQVDGLEVIRN